MHQHRRKPSPPGASPRDGIQNRGGWGDWARVPTHRRRRRRHHPPAPRVSLGGRASLSPCIPPHSQGLTISKLSVFVEHTHIHTHTHTHTALSLLLTRAIGGAESRRREKKNQKVGPLSPPLPPDFGKGGGVVCFGGQEEDATTPRRHTHTTRVHSKHARERTPLVTPRTFVENPVTVDDTGCVAAHAHIPHTHTARRLFCQKNQKAKRFAFFPPTPPTRVSSSP